jgi:reductive dehalogenase
MRLFSNKDRPVHLGPHPMERLSRLSALSPAPAPGQGRRIASAFADPANQSSRPTLLAPLARYVALFDSLRDGTMSSAPAPIPEDRQARSDNLKAHCVFLDADMAGIAAIPDDVWLEACERRDTHRFALVIMVAHPKLPRPDDPGEAWLAGCAAAMAEMRAGENAVAMAQYVRQLGYPALAHTKTTGALDIDRLSVLAGLTLAGRDGAPENPFLGGKFALAIVSTTLNLAPDRPLAPLNRIGRAKARGPAWLLGAGGARPGWDRLTGRHRPLHWGLFPMERVKRSEIPTTLLTDQIPRVPKRAAFFSRALAGDLGPKAQRERARFATKTPNADAMVPLIRAMVPMQDGPVAGTQAPDTDDPDWNAASIKAAGHFLGADMVGISEAPDFAWYSHEEDGTEITPNHRYAITMLIDQGHETMEGASGDDWISGAQSMRSYMRGGEIAGILAEHIRGLGHAARSQTNADSQVLQIPLILLAGLGEMSRIGELVLNPFVGPRFKSVVITTDLPLTVDKPIDFGLQDFCSKCLKCARECPCHAIPFGPKVMFNGYETWKPDAEKCASYRVTNPKGSACGRCMKTCPFNLEGLMGERIALWMAVHLPFTRKWLAILDDKLGRGRRNPTKRWWFDLEIVDGRTQAPRLGTNERDMNFDNILDPATEKIAHYPADMNPAPDQKEPFPPDRKEALRRARMAESPDDARRRLGLG